MIYAIVGAGGKTGLLKEMAAQFRREGKSVFATTTTHMLIGRNRGRNKNQGLVR